MLLCVGSFLKNAAFLAELGYEAMDVDLSAVIFQGEKHDPMLDDDRWEETVDAAGKECARLGIKLSSCHLPFTYRYSEPRDENYEYCHQMACRALQAAQRLGIRWAVMHINKYDKEPEMVISETVAYAKKLLDDSGVTKTGIAIENSTSMKSIEETIQIHDILQKDGYDVGYCLDVGHCHLNKKYENHIPSVVRLLGPRLKMLHLHDNCRNKDLHAVPFAGTIPWEETMVALKEIGYDGDFNMELDFNRVPPSLLKPYLEYSLQVARYLMDVFDKA
ncbi:MAG: sugar phosphate isomerase/epimerase [Clostridia bacterium]|nr:sugar phosphate isomerase/epimerase [Clostridia bacterium]